MRAHLLIEMRGRRMRVDVFVDERALDSARAVVTTHSLNLWRVRVRHRAVGRDKEDDARRAARSERCDHAAAEIAQLNVSAVALCQADGSAQDKEPQDKCTRSHVQIRKGV